MKLVRWIYTNALDSLSDYRYELLYHDVPLARIREASFNWSWQTFSLVRLGFNYQWQNGQAVTLNEAMRTVEPIITGYGFRILTDKEANLL